jgi:micrococcal nuclease
MYTYECNTIRVIDGNTVDAVIDLGFNVTIRQRIKLYGINVEDIRSVDNDKKSKAIASKSRLTELLGTQFICETQLNKRGKAGRIMGNVFVNNPDGSKVNINEQLIKEGFAVRFGD